MDGKKRSTLFFIVCVVGVFVTGCIAQSLGRLSFVKVGRNWWVF